MTTLPQARTGLPRVTAEFQEKLIGEINLRSPLWDPTNAAYQNGAAIEELWYEVAEAMGVPVHVVRSKWKNLRDTFRREKKKMIQQKHTKRKKKPWTYQALMSFIDPFVDVGKCQSDDESELSDNNNNNMSRNFEENINDLSINDPVEDDSSNEFEKINSVQTENDQSESNLELEVPIKQEIIDDVLDEEQPNNLSVKFPYRRRKRIFGKVNGLQSTPLIKKLKPSRMESQTLNNSLDEESDEDNISCFSRHIASELRLIRDPNMLALAKYKISQALFEAQLGVLAISASSPRDFSSGPSPSVFPHINCSTAFPTPTESPREEPEVSPSPIIH